MARIPSPCLIAGRNPVISGHVLQNFQTSPLRTLWVFFRARYDRFFRRLRVLFSLRSYGRESGTSVRVRRNFFRGIELRAFRNVPRDGNLSFFNVRKRFQRTFLNRGARGFLYGTRCRMSCMRPYARFRAMIVFGRFGVPGRLTLIETFRSRAPFVLGRKNVPGARPLRN